MAKHKQVSEWDNFEAEIVISQQARRSCIVGRFLVELEAALPGSAENIIKAFSNPNLTTSAIHRTLKAKLDEWVLPGWMSFQRHRNLECSCVVDGEE